MIGGFTDPEGSRAGIGALLLGVHDERRRARLRGQGRHRLHGQDARGPAAAARAASRSPSLAVRQARIPGVTRAHWVRAGARGARSQFTEWTTRRPPAPSLVPGAARGQDRARRSCASGRAGRREADGRPARAAARPARGRTPRRDAGSQRGTRTGGDEVAGRAPHPPRPRPVSGRRASPSCDLARYYVSIADWILPHLEGRPLTLVRCPEGAAKACFYMKHTGVWAPARAAAREDPGEDEGRRVPRRGRPRRG